MEGASKVSKVPFVDECTQRQASPDSADDSDFEYVESMSEEESSEDDADVEMLELLLDRVHSSGFVPRECLDPAERDSLLYLDKDLIEDVEAGTARSRV